MYRFSFFWTCYILKSLFHFVSLPLRLLIDNFSVKSYQYGSILLFGTFTFVAVLKQWAPELVFFSSALTLGYVTFPVTILAEVVAITIPTGKDLVLETAFSNLAWLVLGMCCVVRGDFSVITDFISGSIISQSLLGVGFGFCLSGVQNQEAMLNISMSSTANSLRMVAYVPFALCWFLLPESKDNMSRSPSNALLIYSRGSSLILLIWYILYWWFRRHSHRALYADTEYGEDSHPSGTTSEPEVYVNSTMALITCEILVSIPIMIFCGWELSRSTSQILERDHAIGRFLTLVILPLLVNNSELVSIAQAGYEGYLDATIVATQNTTLHMMLFLASIYVLFGWTFGSQMTLLCDGVSLFVFGVVTWVIGVITKDGKANYLKGAICISLSLTYGAGYRAEKRSLEQ
ncbi:hypothetical protein K504DRAFT_447009 [Pleomassaria siparia CBS 279.74]|uniref:Sodium/calcium exchanger membrane region domain-containing protein n=1 Tax=Pleomassaria siparia CBS 279.74 TaxID=1314801 RepID=A0A6G1K4Y4_9PLEO|nr:hypothetical protein K504DRAFT_447009 [Pleomassaria siparia CBS 279.74]